MTTAIRPFVALDVVEGGPEDGAPLIVIVADTPEGQISIGTAHTLDAIRLAAELLAAVREVNPALYSEFVVTEEDS